MKNFCFPCRQSPFGVLLILAFITSLQGYFCANFALVGLKNIPKSPGGAHWVQNQYLPVPPVFQCTQHHKRSQNFFANAMSKSFGSFGSKRQRWKEKKKWNKQHYKAATALQNPKNLLNVASSVHCSVGSGLHWSFYMHLVRALKQTAAKLHLGHNSITVENGTSHAVFYSGGSAIGIDQANNRTEGVSGHEKRMQLMTMERDLMKNIRGMFGGQPTLSM